MKLDFKNAVDGLVEKRVLKSLKKYNHVLIFGAGESGSWVKKLLEMHDIKPCCFCDNYKGKWGSIKCGLTVESFQHAMEKYPDSAICIASMWVDEIKMQIQKWDAALLDRTWNLLDTMNWETEEKVFESKEINYIKKNVDELEKMAENYADDISRNTLEGILNYRLTRKIEYINNMRSVNEIYLDTDLLTNACYKKIKTSTIIDGGAYDGDTIRYFIDKLGADTVLKIHAFEIDEINCKKIKEQSKQFAPHQITVHQNALWNESQELFIGGNDLSEKVNVSDAGCSNKITAITIDELNNKNIGFIKLDIEGAERKALDGARDTIKACHPILAICAYHMQDDLLMLYQSIQSMDCEYKIYLRHYMNSAGDTILYAIPTDVIEE